MERTRPRSSARVDPSSAVSRGRSGRRIATATPLGTIRDIGTATSTNRTRPTTAAISAAHSYMLKQRAPKKSPQRLRLKPRRQNPDHSGWNSRNASTILPGNPEGAQGQILERRVPPVNRRWPWQVRAARSEIFEDVNNNRESRAPPPVTTRQRWPWAKASLNSNSIFKFNLPQDAATAAANASSPGSEAETLKSTSTVSRRKWPWQERALKSLIFSVEELKKSKPKNYKWDQRKCHPFFPPSDPSEEKLRQKRETAGKGSKWPWQEKAKGESLIFQPLPPPKEIKTLKYPWDQRQSHISAMFRSKKFEGETKYHEEFGEKSARDGAKIKAAGMHSYPEFEDGNGSGEISRSGSAVNVKVKNGSDSSSDQENRPEQAQEDYRKRNRKEREVSPVRNKLTFTVLQDRTASLLNRGKSSSDTDLTGRFSRLRVNVNENPNKVQVQMGRHSDQGVIHV